MKKLLLLIVCINLLFGETRPTQDDFNVCYEKLKDSGAYIDGMFGLVIKPNLIAVPRTGEKAPKKYLKFDPYLQLYLVSSDTALAPAKLGNERELDKSNWVGILEHNNTQMGHIKELGENLGILDTLSFEGNKTGILSAPCCGVMGISVGKDKFIGSRYLEHFVKSSEVFYGDIGVKFDKTKDDKFIVSEVNPFGKGKMLLKDDEVLSINDIKPKSLRELNEIILFSDKDSIIKVEVLRDGEKIKFDIKISPQNEENNKEDTNQTLISMFDLNLAQQQDKQPPKKIVTPKPKNVGLEFLNKYGLILNNNLTIKSVRSDSTAQKDGFKRGDKIVQIDRQNFKNLSAVNDFIAKADRNTYYFLVSRNDFHFFIRVKR
ncbi:DUF7488 domain-containing protein [Campylobacter sputorum]|uniref:DUF7488 domain-containing protein n=1 Tax=Campylobacter sputorum TaxID=206 RepID=UPI00053BF42F|nr:PDZ domain-containing protein [Campylobacter sputorum]